MFELIRRLIAGDPAELQAGSEEASLDGIETTAQWRFGARRILKIVARQLEYASASSPEKWHSQRAFVFGYVDALADMHMVNYGTKPGGEDSRSMSAAVLRALMDKAWDENVMWVFDIWARQKRDDFMLGRATAIDDYDHWDARPMMGIATRLAEPIPPGQS